MNEAQQRREDLCVSLYHARRQLRACDPEDFNGREDVLHRIRHIEAELGAVDEEAFASFCAALEAAEVERKRLIRERAYAQTGVVSHE